MFELVFSKVFDEDIDSSYNYIKDILESPMAASNLMKELSSKLNYLEEKPYSRSLVKDKYLASFGIRSIRVKNYIVFYIIEDESNIKNVNILRFMYGKRDWMSILKEKTLCDI